MNTVLCPSCGKEVEISQALRHQIEDQVVEQIEIKHKQELETLRKDVEAKALVKAKEDLSLKLKDTETEALEAKERNKALQEQLLSLTKEMRQLQQKDQERDVIMEKKLMDERAKLQQEISKSIQEKSELVILELKKQLDDTKKSLEDAQRKANQGSQQLQGEVMELNLEETLRQEFPDDDVLPVGKGVTGADIRFIVKTKKGTICGEILIESKRTKAWSDEWLAKLKSDIRAEKANTGVIITAAMPKNFPNDFGYHEGIYVTGYGCFIPFLQLLRQKLVEVAYQKYVSQQSGEKADILYDYVTSHEFRQQIESLAEVYNEQLEQITKERAAFERIWKMRESQAKRILLSTTSMYGSMQGIVGGSLGQVKGLDMLELDNGEKDTVEDQKSLFPGD